MNTSSRFYSQERDFLGSLQADLRNLRGITTLVSELTQNADDVKTEDGKPGATMIIFDVCDDMLIVINDGVFNDCKELDQQECPWRATKGRRCDFHRMQFVAGADKRNEAGTTGAFGIGFNTVYQITDHPEIISSGHHLIFHPEESILRRIEDRPGETIPGTRFQLPWAFDATSAVRQRLMMPAVDRSALESFSKEIAAALPFIALFLKQITRLELRRHGRTIRQIRRRRENQDIVISDEGRDIRWRFFSGSLNTEAIRKKYPQIEAKRSGRVTIAVPSEKMEHGRLFAVLPTETTIPLPFHINADFFPSSDRKRILLTDDRDYQVEWNRLAIRMAARVVSDHVSELKSLLGPVGLWNLAQRVFDSHRLVSDKQIDESFKDFWDLLYSQLRDTPTVYTESGRWVRPSEARLLENPDPRASQLLGALGLPVVHSQLRQFYSLFRSKNLGTALLEVADLETMLRQHHLTARTALSEAPPALRDRQGWEVFWGILDTLGRSSHVPTSDIQRLSSYAIAFDQSGSLELPRNLKRFSKEAARIFPGVRWLDTSLPADRIPGHLVSSFRVQQAIEYFRARSSAEIEGAWRNHTLSLPDLYRWLEQHSGNVRSSPQLVDQLRQIPIWPVGGRLRPLTDAFIPGDFEDPLGQTQLVNVAALGGRRDFLRDLKVPELTFATYVRDHLLQFLQQQPGLAGQVKQRLVQLLASRFSEIMHDLNLGKLLGQYAIVECTDGQFRKASLVYARNEVNRELGSGVLLAAAEDEAGLALNRWLGVLEEPQPWDLIQRIKAVAIDKRTPTKSAIVERLFLYLASRFESWDDSRRMAYSELRSLAWLPGSREVPAWCQPSQMYSIFEQHLFSSQANFLGLPYKVQRDSAAFLNFLGVRSTPPVELVVRHLVSSHSSGQSVNPQVYRFLNEHATDAALNRLLDEPCILLNGTYVRPREAFRGPHPFGRFRHTLSSDFQKYYDLIQRLKISDVPGPADAVEMLLDLAALFGGEPNAPLDEEAHSVALLCWEMLSKAIDREDISADDLDDLRDVPVVPDRDRRLRRPDQMFFEDRAGLGAQFSELEAAQVIPRPQGAWLAMTRVGVRALSQAIATRLVEYGTLTPDRQLTDRLRERRLLIERVVEPELVRQKIGADLDLTLDVEVQRASELLVVHQLPGHPATDPMPVAAYLQRGDGEDATCHLLYTTSDQSTPWISVARVLAQALLPGGDIGGVAGGIRDALAQPDLESAIRILDELGYATIQDWSTEHISESETASEDVAAEETQPFVSAVDDEAPSDIQVVTDMDSSADEPGTGNSEMREHQGVSAAAPAVPGVTSLQTPQGATEAPSRSQHQLSPRQKDAEIHESSQAKPTEYAAGSAALLDSPGPQRQLDIPYRAESATEVRTNHASRKQGQRMRGKLRTYVTASEPSEKHSAEATPDNQRSVVDRMGIQHVLRYEQQHGRTPREMPHHQPGYDVQSADASGALRYIEVKSLSENWSEHYAAGLSRRQWETAQQHGDAFWLYVVERAAERDARVYPIRNPAGRVNQFLFDDGWISLAGEQLDTIEDH